MGCGMLLRPIRAIVGHRLLGVIAQAFLDLLQAFDRQAADRGGWSEKMNALIIVPGRFVTPGLAIELGDHKQLRGARIGVLGRARLRFRGWILFGGVIFLQVRQSAPQRIQIENAAFRPRQQVAQVLQPVLLEPNAGMVASMGARPRARRRPA